MNGRVVHLATVKTGDSTDYRGKAKPMVNERTVHVTMATERERDSG
jgi:hypothetical protein